MIEQSPPKSSPNQGRIITFYSYKGGTGRSMAVANVAWILASQGQRVLVIDWDLEAPGLHRYFHPFIEDKELSASPGVIDFLVDFVEGSRLSHHDQGESANDRWFESYTNLLPYAFSLDWEFAKNGTLDFVPAGQQGPGYGVRVMTFDWQGFYDNLGGGVFLEAVKQRLRAEYEYILIDSRTGISDTSGICTVQMPDDLVVCFTLNNQSIRGATAVAESAFGQRRKPTGEPGLRVWPVPTRVELGEQDKLKLARAYSRSKFDGFLDHLRRTPKEEYWGRVETLYFPWYAYEEVLATFGDMPKESNSLLAATERLTAYLTDGKITELAPPSEEERVKVRDQFTREQQIALLLYDVFISYSPHDREWVRSELLPQLEAAGLKVIIDYRDFAVGTPALLNLERAFDNSRYILIVLTPSWLESEWAAFKSLLISATDPAGRQRKILPLLLEHCDLPLRLATLTYADLTNPAERAREMERLIRSTAPYSPSVPSQAKTTMSSIRWPLPASDYVWVMAGRKAIRMRFEQMLTGQSRQRILLVEGASNTGKTLLAAEFRAYAQHLNLATALIDFKGCPSLNDLLQTLCLDLGPTVLPTACSATGTASLYQLISDLQRLESPLALIFDTYEQASADAQTWLETQLLARLDRAPAVVVVIGGQRIPEYRRFPWSILAEAIDLQPIREVDDWLEFSYRKWGCTWLKPDPVQTLVIATGGDPGLMHALLKAYVQPPGTTPTT